MAQTVEIPFSKVFERKSVRNLTMAAFGGFVRIATSALLEGFDPFSASRADLEFRAKCFPRQWGPSKKAILNALADALPTLTEAYSIAVKKKANQKAMGRHFYEKGLGPMKRAATLRNLNKKAQAQTFTPEKVSADILQPTKISRPKLENIDQMAVEKAKSKPQTPGNWLVD